MAIRSRDAGFIVWGVDQTAYGPLQLPTLVKWVKEERVTGDMWIFVVKEGVWRKAAELPELQMFLGPKATGSPAGATGIQALPGVELRALRRVKILAGMSDEQLERLARYMEVERVPQLSVIVKQGDCGNAMYLVLEGSLRVRMNAAGTETILATLGAGDFFGDISLFDHGPRSADVVADASSLILKISSSAFSRLAKEAPDLATPFLLAVGKTLTARIRAGNKHHGEAVKFAHAVQ